jgi:hypothetical protein
MKVTFSCPFAIAFVGVVLAFVVINFWSLANIYSNGLCFDCALPAGFPFTLYRTSSFVGGEGFIWAGMVANAAVAMAIGVVVGYVADLIWKAARSQSSLR